MTYWTFIDWNGNKYDAEFPNELEAFICAEEQWAEYCDFRDDSANIELIEEDESNVLTRLSVRVYSAYEPSIYEHEQVRGVL